MMNVNGRTQKGTVNKLTACSRTRWMTTYTCSICGNDLPIGRENDYSVDDVMYCESCYYEEYTSCDYCGDTIPCDEIVVVFDSNENETYVCDDCAERRYTRCDDCGEYHYHTYTGYDDNEYCHNCIDEHPAEDDYNSFEFDYNISFSPRSAHIEKNPIGRGNRYFGVEIESECRDRAHAVNDIRALTTNRFFQFKSDGSLDGYDGFEMVSQPMTKTLWDESESVLNNVFTALDDAGRYNTGNAGVHVHVNRESFGIDQFEQNYTTGKTIVVFNQLWHSFFKLICRREWQKGDVYDGMYYTKKNADINIDLDVSRETNVFRFAEAFRQYASNTSSRYYAVNIEPSHTIEFRLFGHLETGDELRAVIELLDTVIEFARTSTLKQCYDIHDYKRLFRDMPMSDNLRAFIEGGLND